MRRRRRSSDCSRTPPVVATFDADRLFDYRARRPTLEIVDGRLTELTWPELVLRRTRVGERDLLVLAGPEPDYRWQAFAAAVIELAHRLGVVEWISLGAIPAAVPHTRAVPILGTSRSPACCAATSSPGRPGRCACPAAAIACSRSRSPRRASRRSATSPRCPHYVSGPYPAASLALLEALGRHLGVDLPTGELAEEARQLRTRLDTATALEETTRTYVERLESMVDEQRLPSGDDLIAEIERFLREGGRGAPPD